MCRVAPLYFRDGKTKKKSQQMKCRASTYNGVVCVVSEKDGTYSGQIKCLTAKLPNLNYERPLVYTDRDIRI